jgi:hypothetical protein
MCSCMATKILNLLDSGERKKGQIISAFVLTPVSFVSFPTIKEPGDMILYESHSVIHGRPFPLQAE